MFEHLIKISIHIVTAMAAGGLIGLERRYNGHAAGFRTHTLVCMASSVLMLLVIYQQEWMSDSLIQDARIDPTRMAQGIMTGIGFLGAGVIMKGGLSVQGLTTAASIWITSAIGILAGAGFYSAVVVVTLLTLGTLSVFRWLESRLPSLIYAQCSIRFDSQASMSGDDLRALLALEGFDVMKLSYESMQEHVKGFTYNMMIRTRKREHFEDLSRKLTELTSIHEFRISLTGD